MTSLSTVLVVSEPSLTAGAKRCLAELPVRTVLEEATVPDWNEFSGRVETLGVDAIIVDLGAINDPIETVMERVARMPKPPAVIALHVEANPEVILRSIRAGAMEYCYPPVEKPLKAALEKLIRQKAESTPTRGSGKTFGFLGAKGGCGTTSIACHLGTALPSILEDRVLLADFDLAGGMLSFLLKAKPHYSVVQAIQNAHRLDPSFWQALVTNNGIPKLDLLTAPPRNFRQPLPVNRLANVLQYARSAYKATVVDLGRFLTTTTLSAVEELDKTFIVTTLDVLALHQAKNIIEALLDVGYQRDRLALVVNRVTAQRQIDPEEVEKLLGVPIVSVLPDDTSTINEAYAESKLLGLDSKLYQHIIKLARRLADVPEVVHKKKFLFFGS